jgi:hypothetical protein
LLGVMGSRGAWCWKVVDWRLQLGVLHCLFFLSSTCGRPVEWQWIVRRGKLRASQGSSRGCLFSLVCTGARASVRCHRLCWYLGIRQRGLVFLWIFSLYRVRFWTGDRRCSGFFLNPVCSGPIMLFDSKNQVMRVVTILSKTLFRHEVRLIDR